MKTIKALISFAYIGENGSITSFTGGQIYDVSNSVATQMIAVGYAEEYGGGGSSDFTTAEVTVVNNLGQVIRNVNCFAYYEAGSLGGGSPACVANFIQLAEGSNTINTVLYKGGAFWRAPFDEDVTIVTSGDVTNNDGMLFITGDCTITIS